MWVTWWPSGPLSRLLSRARARDLVGGGAVFFQRATVRSDPLDPPTPTRVGCDFGTSLKKKQCHTEKKRSRLLVSNSVSHYISRRGRDTAPHYG